MRTKYQIQSQTPTQNQNKKQKQKRTKIFFCWISAALLMAALLCGCFGKKAGKQAAAGENAPDWEQMKIVRSMETSYAKQFAVDYYEDGYALVTIADTDRYLLVPEDKDVPKNLEEEIVVLQKPLDHIYLAATSAMDLIRALDCLDRVDFSGTDASGWYIEEAKQAMTDGKMEYAGKYSAPDYEKLLAGNCDLAVESTMIYHTPEVMEQLNRLGIPVLVERSSYESHPLGRMEWIRLYGVLMDKEEEADAYFASQVADLDDVFSTENTGKTVVFFYITSNGMVNVRKSGDYVTKMIELAGGVPVCWDEEEENALSTMTIQMEAFYDLAKDADYLIYNSAIDKELTTMEELLEKSELLSDFKAVENKNVWCTEKNMFQETTGFGDMIMDIHRMLTGDNAGDEEFVYLHRLKGE